MISALNLLLLQTVVLPGPDPLQSYNWCVYRMAEVRANQPTEGAVREALVICETGPLLDAAVTQVVSVASGSATARAKVAGLLRRQAEVNALARLNLIRSYARDEHAPNR